MEICSGVHEDLGWSLSLGNISYLYAARQSIRHSLLLPPLGFFFYKYSYIIHLILALIDCKSEGSSLLDPLVISTYLRLVVRHESDAPQYI